MLARARAFVYYFNTERNAVYCVLYVFLFILYNTVFFIVEPCYGLVELTEMTIHPHDWSNSTTMCLARGRASRGGAL